MEPKSQLETAEPARFANNLLQIVDSVLSTLIADVEAEEREEYHKRPVPLHRLIIGPKGTGAWNPRAEAVVPSPPPPAPQHPTTPDHHPVPPTPGKCHFACAYFEVLEAVGLIDSPRAEVAEISALISECMDRQATPVDVLRSYFARARGGGLVLRGANAFIVKDDPADSPAGAPGNRTPGRKPAGPPAKATTATARAAVAQSSAEGALRRELSRGMLEALVGALSLPSGPGCAVVVTAPKRGAEELLRTFPLLGEVFPHDNGAFPVFDYTDAELAQILEGMAAARGLALAPALAQAVVREHMAPLRGTAAFGFAHRAQQVLAAAAERADQRAREAGQPPELALGDFDAKAAAKQEAVAAAAAAAAALVEATALQARAQAEAAGAEEALAAGAKLEEEALAAAKAARAADATPEQRSEAAVRAKAMAESAAKAGEEAR